jgi:DNA-binding MarR family transcriptional regulator
LAVEFRSIIVKMADDPQFLVHLTSAAADARRAFRNDMAARGFPWHLNASGDVVAHLPPGGLSQAALVASMGLSKQAVQQLLDQLEAAGVVRREIDPADRRARRVVLTELGLRDRAEQKQALARLEADVRDRLGKKLHGKFEKALRKLG